MWPKNKRVAVMMPINLDLSKSKVLNIKSPLPRKDRGLFSTLSLLFLGACGGGGKTNSDQLSIPSEEEFLYTGAVIKGPLQNATVFLDYNGDGVLSADEPSMRTNADGSFELLGNVAEADFVAQTDADTIDTSSGEVLDNVVLKASAGSSVVTPATTIMKEAGITKEEVASVLGLPDGVDPTSFNPYSADADLEQALAVEKISQQVMTTITTVSAAVEGAGADKAAAFSVALETVVEIVKEKAEVAKTLPAGAEVKLDLSNTAEIQTVTEKVSAKIEEQGIAAKEDFEAVKSQLDVAVSNVNSKINEVTDLSSEDSMAAFAVAAELNSQVKAAVEAKGDPSAAISFVDVAAIEETTAEKAAEIKEKIESGELVTKPETESEPETTATGGGSTGGGGGGGGSPAPETPVSGDSASPLEVYIKSSSASNVTFAVKNNDPALDALGAMGVTIDYDEELFSAGEDAFTFISGVTGLSGSHDEMQGTYNGGFYAYPSVTGLDNEDLFTFAVSKLEPEYVGAVNLSLLDVSLGNNFIDDIHVTLII